MPPLRRVLSHGFFPYEVPQVFTSRSFARIGHARAAPREFILQKPWTYGHADLAKHNLARKGKLRRILGIPNPLLFYNTAREVVDCWKDIDAALHSSMLTATRIIADYGGQRGLAPEHGPPDFPRLRARHRTNRRYLLVADILQFYPSLYTHTIPWAIHGKPVGKAAMNDWSLPGNRLDFWMRQAQDRQTRGVPIGPDTSRLIAELVLVGVDQLIQKRVPGLQGFRALDDYELSFRTRSEAESALAELQSALAEYELQLNESKTDILELPLPLEGAWPLALRDFRFKARSPRRLIGELTEYFSLAFRIAQANPTESVLKYAIARASAMDWSGRPWMTYQDLLLQCATAEPGVLKHVTAELSKYKSVGQKLDRDRITSLAEFIVEDHVPLGHGSEVVWPVWLLVALGLRLSPTMERIISGYNDPLVPLVALHAKSRRLTGASLDTSAREQHMTRDSLLGPHWLLAYEAGVRKWLPTKSRRKHHVDQDPRFKYLREKGVRFYNTRASAREITRWRPRMTLSQVIGYGI